ncbi:DUF4834 family protein [Salinimicrobium soli]|uniref:DUF4834 family protein n=1 Tax=Salinimicrobium soli TaxID=1254399 RepID=UPI003AAA9A46
MQEASFSGVIRVVLIILLIYFGFKLIVRWFGPMILRYFLQKMGKKFGEQFQQFDHTRNTQKEGEVSIEKEPENSRKSKKDVGEYIDYEEID